MPEYRYRLGVDIGGTFTDFSLYDQGSNRITELKVPTVPLNPSQGVVNGLQELQHLGTDLSQIGYFVHGTTIGLNTLLQRKGANLALLCTEGFRDILEIQRLRLPIPYDVFGVRPKPLIPRERVFPVRERVLPTGEVFIPLNHESLDRAIHQALSVGVEGIVICFINSYIDSMHELLAKRRVQELAPDLYCVCSAELWPQMREYERAMVAVMNAYIRPQMDRYLTSLESEIRALGMNVRPYITKSNGGIMTAEAARQEPIHVIFSGPSSGVTGAVLVARNAGFSNLITLDMGGTSADIAVIENNQPEAGKDEHVGDFPVLTPSVAISSIGAGGGSIAWIDPGGVLKVGPESAGANPGPACYGMGGLRPTLTDAFLLCGYIAPDRLLGGRVKLEPDRSLEAVSPLSAALGLTPEGTGNAIVEVATSNMYAEFSGVIHRRGLDPRDYALLAFGGAGPIQACLLADEFHIPHVLVPRSPGTLCALGALSADVMHDQVRTVNWSLRDVDAESFIRHLRALEEQARSWLDREGPLHTEMVAQFGADMRYVGQSWEIEVPLERAWVVNGNLSAVATAFHEMHEHLFLHSDSTAEVEVVNLRVRLVGSTAKPRLPRVQSAIGEPVARMYRSIILRGRSMEAAAYDREALQGGHRITGPALIDSNNSTVLVPPHWRCDVDGHGNLILTREA